MAGLKVYYDLMSQPSRAVVLFLKVNNIDFVDKSVALRKGEHLSDEYGKINPFHLVPAIDDNGFILTESIAILKYISRKYELADNWYPRDLHRQARLDEYLNWFHLNTRIRCSMLFRAAIIEPRMKNAPVDQERLRKFRTELDTSLDHVERIFLRENDYLAGRDISIADVMAICEVMQPLAAGFDVKQNRPKTAAWMERVKARLQPHFDDTHKMLYRLIDKAAPGPKM